METKISQEHETEMEQKIRLIIGNATSHATSHGQSKIDATDKSEAKGKNDDKGMKVVKAKNGEISNSDVQSTSTEHTSSDFLFIFNHSRSKKGYSGTLLIIDRTQTGSVEDIEFAIGAKEADSEGRTISVFLPKIIKHVL